MNTLQRRIVDDFETAAGRHDDPEIFGGPAGDPGLIGPGSMSWEINADLAAVSQAGLPAIVLEILHPSVVAGVQDHSDYRQDPFQRARATLGYVLTTTFGNTAAATALIDRVHQIHSHVTGTRPDGVPYRALDPELIAWVHTCIPWMILRAYEGTKRRLTVAEKDAYLAEQAVDRPDGGADRVPTTVAELDDYVATMRPKLGVNAQTREFIDFLMTAPFSPFGLAAGVGGPGGAPVRDIRGDEPCAAVGARADRVRPTTVDDESPHRTATGARREASAMGVRHAALRRAGPGADRIRLLRWRHVDGRRTRGACAQPHRRGSARCDGPDLRAHSRCSGVGGGTRWPATDHRRGCGPACGGVEDDGIPSVSAARRPRGGPGAARDTAVPGRGGHRDRRRARIRATASPRRSSPPSGSPVPIPCCAGRARPTRHCRPPT